MKIFRYNCKYWNEIDEKDDNEYGYVWGKDYGDATNKVVSIYGEDYVFTISISETDAFDVGIITDEMIKEEFEQDYKNE